MKKRGSVLVEFSAYMMVFAAVLIGVLTTLPSIQDYQQRVREASTMASTFRLIPSVESTGAWSPGCWMSSGMSCPRGYEAPSYFAFAVDEQSGQIYSLSPSLSLVYPPPPLTCANLYRWDERYFSLPCRSGRYSITSNFPFWPPQTKAYMDCAGTVCNIEIIAPFGRDRGGQPFSVRFSAQAVMP